MNSRGECRKTFSLHAFQSLISRRARQVSRYLSHRNPPSCTTCAFLHNIDIPSSVTLSTQSNGSNIDLRSITAESDCSDDDSRDDEGWIPITLQQNPSSSPPLPIKIKHKKNEPSLASSFSSLSSLFTESELSPPSTPASSLFADCVVCCSGESIMKKDKPVRDGSVKGGDRTMRWILESEWVV